MTAEQFRKALDRLSLSQVGAARLLRINDRTVRRWAKGDLPVPHVVQMTLQLMIKQKISFKKKPKA